MSLKIKDNCINCDMCVAECPNYAISMGNKVYQIDHLRCTECVGHYDAPSCMAACPLDCITKDPDKKESLAQLVQKYAALQG